MFLQPDVEVAEEKQNIPIVEITAKTLEKFIADYAIEKEVDPDLILRIAKCESGLNPKAKNPNSTASGVFQFINSTWNHYCKGDVFNAKDNVTCAVDLIADGGLSHWRADPRSESCWDK